MKESKRFDPLALVSKITRQEKELIGTTFIAPYVGGAKVRLRLDGIICEMQVKDCPEGWAILEVVGNCKARFVQRAPLSMVKNYLRLFPRIRMVLIDRFDDLWWALSATAAPDTGQKIQLDGPVPVHLTERAAVFETAYCRFDGSCFWFEASDRRRDPAVARQLRQALANDLKPEELHCKGMVPQERLAYKMLYLQKHKDVPAAKPDDSTRIANALAHAGARLDSFWFARGDEVASVRFQMNGNTRVVQIRPADLSVVSAGICLSGRDSDFDLTSLVGVLREADDEYNFD